MLHIELFMPPTAGNILGTQEEIPGGVTETVGVVGESRWSEYEHVLQPVLRHADAAHDAAGY